MIFDLDAFHILSADVEDAVYIWLEESSSVVVRDCLDFAVIQHQCSLDQGFTIARRAGVDDGSTGRQEPINLLNGTYRCGKRTAVIITVEGIQERAVLADKSNLGGRRAGVDAEKCLTLIGSKVGGE